MKIGLVLDASLEMTGGVQEYVHGLHEYLIKQGHQAEILTPQTTGLAKSLEIKRPFSSSSATLAFTDREKLSRFLKKEKFDILHFQAPFGIFGGQVLQTSGSVNVATFLVAHESKTAIVGYKALFSALKNVAKKLDGKIAISEAAARFAKKFLPGEYRIIPPGVDIERFSRAKPCLAGRQALQPFRDGKLNILFVGRLDDRKGLIYLLKAFRLIKQEFANARLVVVGSGPKEREAKRFVKKHHLRDVEFVGFVESETLPRYYTSADIFCSPATHGESFGIVLIEAMAAGLPVVAFDNQGHRCVLRKDFLVENRDVEALAKKLLSFLQSDGLREKASDWSRWEVQKYSWEKVGREIVEFYEVVAPRGVEPLFPA